MKPITKIYERVSIAKNDSDTSYFLYLMYTGEQLTKLITAGLISCINDDSERHRYSQIFRLIRADGIGEWSSVIEEVLTGISSQFFNSSVNHLQRELTERLGAGTWQYKSIALMINCLKIVEPTIEDISTKVSCKTWFSLFAMLRNKTRGHGADPSDIYSSLCPSLNASIKLIVENYSLLNTIQWAHLNRNLSGKYKVSDISTTATDFHYLRTDRDSNFENGIHIFIKEPVKVELIESDSDLSDFYFANGGFTNKQYEVLSYITGNKDYKDASSYLTPPGDLPSSETEGIGKLELLGNCFTNLPEIQKSYIRRLELEKELKNVLLDDRHPIVTLIGRGGIGKTSLAISVLYDICYTSRFSAIIWFSSRDIDLLLEGAKPVKRNVYSDDDISLEYIKLIEPKESTKKKFRPKEYLEKDLTLSTLGPTLFIFDNFETVRNPIDLFQWLDTYIRTPNKILITSRFRDFKADYPIEVKGMNIDEFNQLVSATAENLSIKEIINSPEYLDELYTESDGHPYVVKVLLGEVAKEGKIGKIKRIVAGKDEILTALFERTFNGLSPAAKRVFLTLSNWRSTIPELAIAAVLMREENEHMDVEEAIEELHRSSLIDLIKSEKDETIFISVPLSASVFGKKKLAVSPMKTAIEADTRILVQFGAGQNIEIHQGIGPRINKFFKEIAKRVTSFKTKEKFEDYTPILEFICRKYSPAWPILSTLYEELGKKDKAIEALQSFLEQVDDEDKKLLGWQKLLRLYSEINDWNGETHALVEICELTITPFQQLSNAVNRINALLKENKLKTDSSEKGILVQRIVQAYINRLESQHEKNASSYSSLAWLYLHLDEKKNARKAVNDGLKIEPNNTHCLKLKEFLN